MSTPTKSRAHQPLVETVLVTASCALVALVFGVVLQDRMAGLRDGGMSWKAPLASGVVAAVVWYVLAATRRRLSYAGAGLVGLLIVVMSHGATWLSLGMYEPKGLLAMTFVSLAVVGIVTMPVGFSIGAAALAWRRHLAREGNWLP
jgi:hypothetical protein